MTPLTPSQLSALEPLPDLGLYPWRFVVPMGTVVLVDLLGLSYWSWQALLVFFVLQATHAMGYAERAKKQQAIEENRRLREAAGK